MMTPALFNNGLTLFVWDLTADRCGGYHIHARRTGNIDLEVRFEKPLPAAVYAIAFCTYDAQIVVQKENKKNRISANILLAKSKKDY